MVLVRLIGALSALLVAGAVEAAEDAGSLAFFETKVRPVLVEHCYSCHSAQAKKLRGGLLLDTKAGWSTGGDSGPAVVPGNPENSLLIKAVRYAEPDLKMPPKGKLPAEVIAVLVDWVKRGAPDPRIGSTAKPAQRPIDIAQGRTFWAFRPLTVESLPAVHNEAWCRSPIDRFILAKLEENGLTPNEPAGKRTLIRRAYLDVIGLPPTPEEVDAFVNDPAPDAYEKVIDHLLASPHYGERWGRHWLDLARFAESHGFEHDTDRPTAYPYRDFVIEALNRDLPYDTFVKWQLAGDELAPDDPLALKATGFLAAGVHSTQITANQVEKERYDELDDIVATTGTAMLGLTIGCARCHDHKYDPIPQRDYYRLVSTFTTTVRTEVDLEVDPPGYQEAKAAFEKEHAPYLADLRRFESEELPARFERWEREKSTSLAEPRWVILEPVVVRSSGGATLKALDDGSFLASGKNPDFDTYTFEAVVDLEKMTAVRVEALADPSLVKGGPGRADNGNFDLTDLRVTAAPIKGGGPARAIRLENPRASFEQKGLPIRAAIDADPRSGWAVDPQFGKDHAAVFETPGDVGFAGGTRLTFTLVFRGNNRHNFGRTRLSVSTASRPAILGGDAIPQRVLTILRTPHDRRTAEQSKTLLHWYRRIDPEWQARNRVVDEHARKAPKPRTIKAMISSEGLPAVRLNTQGGDFLAETHFLKRGDPNQKQGVATQGFLQVLMPTPEHEKHWQVDPPKGWRTSYRRMSLARWITDADNGAGALLARVIVNRLWQHHLGRGIVATPSDFGAQGERPSHPELLDWLASDLVRNGWRLKPTHKRIMMSATYLQSARIDPAREKADHENRLVWHVPRRRLEAEPLRDAMLAVAGKLDDRMYGPGTLDERQTRRSIYFTVKRSHLIPMMVLFDAPDALQGLGSRSSTTIAPQSLLLMNSPIVREWAAGFAQRIADRANGSPERAVREAYRIALARDPNEQERADALAFLERQKSITGPDQALVDFCQVLLGLNEFAYTA